MDGQTIMRLVGIVLWIAAVLILMATYSVLAKPTLETELSKGFFEVESMYYSGSLVLSILFLTIGTFLIVYPFKKLKK
ncbi:MAG: hypothetical protein GTN36_06230 [Candidatus Aenigmarchaeota archaeon]|nr:hypothetical protein [Candidatus Aenigmarchaeota archaeon]